jgi:hypothetical protein
MMRRISGLAAALVASAILSLSPTEAAQTRRLTFRDGHATATGTIRGDSTHDYVFPVGAGESFSVRLDSRKAYVNVNPPGSDEAIFIGSTSGPTFDGAATVSGDYTARVYLMRNEARRGATAPYRLSVALGQKSAAAENGPDFADGLSGGPDNWRVTGVGAGDTLKLRATPSPRGKLVAQAQNGATLRNLGCRNTRGQRWCQVEDASGARGWANGRYLRE